MDLGGRAMVAPPTEAKKNVVVRDETSRESGADKTKAAAQLEAEKAAAAAKAEAEAQAKADADA